MNLGGIFYYGNQEICRNRSPNRSHNVTVYTHKTFLNFRASKPNIQSLTLLPKILNMNLKSTLSKLDGFNITIPHKQAVIPFLDEIDAKAEMYGSVNTVSNKNGISKGYTTDPDGFFKGS